MALANFVPLKNKPEKVTMYYKKGSSDKVYQVQLMAIKDMSANPYGDILWSVHSAYGRRGSNMRHLIKVEGTPDYSFAKNEYDKLVKAKLRKGYQVGPGGTPFNQSQYRDVMEVIENSKDTGWLPQLLNQVTFEEAAGIYRAHEGDILLQTKWDGERRGVICKGDVVGANRKGQTVPLEPTIKAAIDRLCRQTSTLLTLDTEDMGDYLTIFDVLKYGREDLMARTFLQRTKHLQLVNDALSEMNTPFLMVDMPYLPNTYIDFVNYIEDAKERNEEGVVIRVGSTAYSPGKPNSGGGLYKLKFKESATCVVEFIHPTKSSVGLELKDEATGQWVSVGNTTIYPNSIFPEEGDIVEVEYLYAYPGGSLFQPVYKGPRNDIGEDAAVLSQLKYKKGIEL